MTLREAAAEAAARLSDDPLLCADARRDAEHLLRHAARLTRAQFLADPARQLVAEEESLFRQSIDRRLKHEPIQYITGRQEFYGLTLRVTPAVLIPRPETELLVEAVLAHFKGHLSPLRIADVGTGSGAIALALARHLPQAEITALDLSPEALAVAESNAQEYGLANHIHIVESDLLAQPIIHLQSFDAIVSNPPYVALADMPELNPQVRDYEPPVALFAGPTGFDVYRRLIPQAFDALLPGGLLAIEIGHGQRESIAAMLADWRDVTFLDDLQRIPRVALASR